MEPEDIYTELLGVPPGPRPPNHYEILRLPLFEADREVIHDAVLRQAATLKLWVLDPRRMSRIQDLLNEVHQAYFILDDPQSRDKYERELAARLGIPLPARTPAVRQPPAPERHAVQEPRPKQAEIAPPPTPAPVRTRVAWPFSEAEAKRRQDEAARALGVPAQKEVAVGCGLRLAIVLIPPGEFDMGSPAGEAGRSGDERLHRVKIPDAFWIAQYEVTQEQWRAVMGGNPSGIKGDQNPVENMSWNDCQDFLRRLNGRGGKGRFALPTEAQWEWACRAGSSSRFSFGDRDGDLGQYAWYSGNSGRGTHRVGQKKPNAWGLYDMHGNVWEWVASPYSDRYDGSETQCPGGAVGVRVLRGGSWRDYLPWRLRSARRVWRDPGHRDICLGSRVVWRSQE